MEKLRSKKMYLIAGGAVLIVLGAIIFFVFGIRYQLTVVDGASVAVISTRAKTGKDILALNGYKIDENDKITTIKEDKQISKIIINRANTLTVVHDGLTEEVTLTGESVQDGLEKLNVELGTCDNISEPLNSIVDRDITVTVQRVRFVNETLAEEIAYQTVTKQVQTVPRGKTKVVTQGVAGQKLCNYNEIYVDGECILKNEVSQSVISNPVTQVEYYGTGGTIGGKSFSYYIDMKAYAYTSTGRTATGKAAARGMVAVDKSVIPLGTKLYVKALKGSFVYGTCSAEDTGGAIKGNVIDLFMNSEQECRSFGVRKVRVYIFD